MQDFELLARSFSNHPTWCLIRLLREIVPDYSCLTVISAGHAKKAGMGSKLFTDNHAPVLWHVQFLKDILQAKTHCVHRQPTWLVTSQVAT